MKFIFLCGALPFGKNGVGDYTRRLAAEIIRRNYSALIIGLYDVVDSCIYEEQFDNNTKVNVIRISQKVDNKLRFQIINEIIEKERPNCISLQYVPFSFNKKGLPFFLATDLKKVCGQVPFHIMFHELWVGLDSDSTVKMKFFGMIQKFIINSMIEKLVPQHIHTHSELYLNLLNTNKRFKSTKLPLFSNINYTLTQPVKRKEFIAVLFGGIHRGAPASQFLVELHDYCISIERPLRIIFVGKNGDFISDWINVCIEKNITVSKLGEQEVEVIYGLFQSSDIGIATTPYLLVEKSGSVAAMLEHGLKVICVSRPWKVVGYKNKIEVPNLYLFREGNLSELIGFKRKSYELNLNVICSQFLNDLNNV